ncbi:hypothetical protein COI_0184 [Mannheimia haemolytica serotype A2 str. OVINE]|nr:hypothetical protein COI_0184 [Mannheimia haemolytica serotype A2 str. OVINE]EEY11550.1 hypothetical protein COK_2384 [Mannheimia haemolytica serotype A2 str. BOVINE]
MVLKVLMVKMVKTAYRVKMAQHVSFTNRLIKTVTHKEILKLLQP